MNEKTAYITVNAEGDVEILFEGGVPNLKHKVIVQPFKKVFNSITIKQMPITVDELIVEKYNNGNGQKN